MLTSPTRPNLLGGRAPAGAFFEVADVDKSAFEDRRFRCRLQRLSKPRGTAVSMLAISIDGLDSATQARLQRTLDGKLKQISARPASAIDDADREVIQTALRISAAKSLERRDGSSSELLLLKLVVRFVKAGRSLSTVELVDVILSFPRHATAIRRHILASLSPSALSELQQQVIEPLLRRLGAHVEPRVVYALQVLAGSFSTIAQMILSSSSASQVLNDAYASLQRSERPRNETVWCKSHILLLLHSLLGNLPLPEQEWKLALLNEDPSSSSSKTSARPLVNAGLADDYATFFRSKESLPVGDEEIRILETLQQPHNLATASVDSKVSRSKRPFSRKLLRFVRLYRSLPSCLSSRKYHRTSSRRHSSTRHSTATQSYSPTPFSMDHCHLVLMLCKRVSPVSNPLNLLRDPRSISARTSLTTSPLMSLVCTLARKRTMQSCLR